MDAALPRPDRCIVLVGLMGVGKSSVGRRLARRLGMPFVDSDEAVEEAADRKVAEIFEDYGESAFRDVERRVIARLVGGEPKVIATGGGAFVDAETRALVLARCIAIWLDADIATLAERVARRGHRPLLRNHDPRQVLAELAAVRNPAYAEAHLRVESRASPHERTVEAVLEALRQRDAASG